MVVYLDTELVAKNCLVRHGFYGQGRLSDAILTTNFLIGLIDVDCWQTILSREIAFLLCSFQTSLRKHERRRESKVNQMEKKRIKDREG